MYSDDGFRLLFETDEHYVKLGPKVKALQPEMGAGESSQAVRAAVSGLWDSDQPWPQLQLTELTWGAVM